MVEDFWFIEDYKTANPGKTINLPLDPTGFGGQKFNLPGDTYIYKIRHNGRNTVGCSDSVLGIDESLCPAPNVAAPVDAPVILTTPSKAVWVKFVLHESSTDDEQAVNPCVYWTA